MAPFHGSHFLSYLPYISTFSEGVTAALQLPYKEAVTK